MDGGKESQSWGVGWGSAQLMPLKPIEDREYFRYVWSSRILKTFGHKEDNFNVSVILHMESMGLLIIGAMCKGGIVLVTSH